MFLFIIPYVWVTGGGKVRRNKEKKKKGKGKDKGREREKEGRMRKGREGNGNAHYLLGNLTDCVFVNEKKKNGQEGIHYLKA